MSLLFVADLHYALKQFDWLAANAANFDPVVIGGDLLDLASALELDVQIVVVEKYLKRIRQLTRLIVSSGNHDGDARNAEGESVVQWIPQAKAPQLYVDGDCVELGSTMITVCPWWDGPISRGQLESLLQREAARVGRLQDPGRSRWRPCRLLGGLGRRHQRRWVRRSDRRRLLQR